MVQMLGEDKSLLNKLEFKYPPQDFIPPLLQRCQFSGPEGFLACFYSTADGEGIIVWNLESEVAISEGQGSLLQSSERMLRRQTQHDAPTDPFSRDAIR